MRLRSFIQSEDGVSAIITAFCAVAIIGCAGLATDVGSVYLDSRRLQGTADVAALAAMNDPSRAQSIATDTVGANNWPQGTRVETVLGSYTADRSIPVGERFQRGAAGDTAVQVQVTSTTPLYFGRLFIPSGQMTIVRRATAAEARLASFQIGSRLLSVQGGIANQVLSGLTGSQVSLSVMDYNALANADVDLLSYVDALHTNYSAQAASFDQTLSQNITSADAINTLANMVHSQNSRASRALQDIAEAASHSGLSGSLNRVVDLGPYAAQDHVNLAGTSRISVNALDLATAMLEIAGGDRQVRLQLGTGVPGIASTNVWLAIGERPNNSPWLTVTDNGSPIIRTAQARLYIEANVRPALVALVNVRIPVLLELASAQARLSDIRCGSGVGNRSVTLSVAPSIGSLSLGEVDTARLDDFRSPLQPSPGRLVDTGLVSVTGAAHIDVGGEQWTPVRFSGGEIQSGAVKSVATRDAAQATISSLLGRTQLSVRGGGLTLGAPVVTPAVQSTLTSAAAPLDSLINSLSDLLGLRLGEADVRVNGVRCGGAALVA